MEAKNQNFNIRVRMVLNCNDKVRFVWYLTKVTCSRSKSPQQNVNTILQSFGH